MRVDCEGCAGCCLDWRPLVPDGSDHERRGGREPLDDRYNLPTLSGREVRAFLGSGDGDALTIRLFAPGDGDDAVRVDGHELAAIRGRPAFVVGLRAVPKPVAPFPGAGEAAPGRRWLSACVFLDPNTLQCRIHGDDVYPETCATYPGTNLRLGRETECERVEDAFGGERLVDDEPPADAPNPFDPGALGGSVFAHPSPDALEGSVDRIVSGNPRRGDLAPFIGVAAGSSPGTLAVDEGRARRAEETLRSTGTRGDSWIRGAVDGWIERAGEPGAPVTGPWTDLDEANGAPETPGWDRVKRRDDGE
ncbi:MAG: YkgJ family cysteine cluster protein [Haloferacaceae archaeon]